MLSVKNAMLVNSPCGEMTLISSLWSMPNSFASFLFISQKFNGLNFKSVLGRFVFVPVCHWSRVRPVSKFNGYILFVFSLKSLFWTKCKFAFLFSVNRGSTTITFEPSFFSFFYAMVKNNMSFRSICTNKYE